MSNEDIINKTFYRWHMVKNESVLLTYIYVVKGYVLYKGTNYIMMLETDMTDINV